MILDIFDVTHGFCAYLIADNGNVMLFDCGHNERTGFRPSEHLSTKCTKIERLIIQNFDQDHISDLPNLLEKIPVEVFHRNRSLSSSQLTALKQQTGSLTTAMQRTVKLHTDFIHPVTNPPEFPNIEFKAFHNNYPTFEDTNNLSVVSFINYDGVGIAFTGDIEKEGWDALLEDTEFCTHLSRTTIFIASHHGRVNGYCKEVFDYCSPEIVIISDKEIVHDTQKELYRKHASGVTWDGGPEKRYVLTTRSDGNIRITKNISEGYKITTGVELT